MIYGRQVKSLILDSFNNSPIELSFAFRLVGQQKFLMYQSMLSLVSLPDYLPEDLRLNCCTTERNLEREPGVAR